MRGFAVTPAEMLFVRRRDLHLARVDLRNASARFGAIVNSRTRPALSTYEEAGAAVDAASRAFVRAEIEVAEAERIARAATEADEAAKAVELAKRARRSHLCVIDGGE